jgi:DNA-binding NarL/FixJ family response regulator
MPIKILLVDDQVLFRGALRALMGTMGELQVVGEAEDGNEAVRLTKALSPDVVVMDLALPGIDGFEATRQIRRAYPRTPVLLLSGYADRKTQDKAANAGAACVMEKRDLDRLLPAIKAALSQPGAAPPA